MTRVDVAVLAREAGLPDAARIAALARPAAVLRPISEIDGDDAGEALAGSWLGGKPLLPPSTAWPSHDGHSLAFVAQIDLGNLPAGVAADGLPRDGHLAFFYAAEQATWGFDPNDAGSFAVIHVPSGAEVGERDLPDDLVDDGRFPPTPLAAMPAIALPPGESVLIDALGLTPSQATAYSELLEQLTGDGWAARCLLGGHPDQIQGDIMLECAMVAGGGLYAGDAAAYETPRMPEFQELSRDWRLLLQVPSSEDAGMMWGDLGCLYFCIRGEDLRAGRFDRVWMVLQCS
jgi:uncharacterized protein YwqG